jgi:hypothetical protein
MVVKHLSSLKRLGTFFQSALVHNDFGTIVGLITQDKMQGEKKKRKRKRNQSKGKELPGAEAGG